MARTRRTYSDQQRTDALALYATAGPTAVEERLGIPKQTVQDWAKQAGVRTVRNEQTAAAVEAARLDWELRREHLAHDIGEAAEEALLLAREKIADGTPSSAKDAALTMAIMVDKAQLLTGAATSRTAHVSDLDAEIERLTAELAEHDRAAA